MTKEEKSAVKKTSRIDAMKQPKRNPLETTNFLFKLTFDWLTPLILKGAYRTLQLEDIYDLPKSEKPDVLCKSLEEKFEKRKHQKNGLLWALHSFVGIKFWLSGLLKLLMDLFVVASPLFIRYLLESLNDPRVWVGWVWVSVLFVAQLGVVFFGNTYFYYINFLSVRLRTSLSALIYKKSLYLSNRAKLKKTQGETVNLLSVDAQKLGEVTIWVHLGWTGIFTIIIALAFLFWFIGWVTIVGLGIMILTIPIQSIFMRLWFKYTKQILKHRDDRLKLITEILSGIRIIKFFNWEENYIKSVEEVRRYEVKELIKFAMVRAVAVAIFMTAPLLVSVCTFIVYYAVGNELTASVVFSSMAYFNILRMPLNIMIIALNFIAEGYVSIKRIQEFLLYEEIPPIESHDDKEYPIIVENATFQWDARPAGKKKRKTIFRRFTKTKKETELEEVREITKLENISLKIKRGELVCIVGRVGSGKSSLLNGILGEMRKVEGKVTICGSMAYCPQEAWIQNCTLRDNITFGSEYDHEKYNHVINICALRKDLEILDYGDLTEIGEKGINLSGGQRQRISIARAAYQDRDIYIFDDPLSAVDPEVGKHIFENCILNHLKGKTRVLVTHQLHFLSSADTIVVIDDGKIIETGTFEELNQKKDGHLQQLIKKFLTHEEKKNEEEKEKSNEDTDEVSKQLTKEEEEEIKERARLVQDEERATGGVSISVFWDYAKAAGVIVVILILLVFALAQVALVSPDVWMSLWTSQAIPSLNHWQWYYLIIYGCLGVASGIVAFIRNSLFFVDGVIAASRLHSKSFRRVMRAPMWFFDSTPLGRFLNRFSKDQEVLDTTLVVMLSQTISAFFQIVAAIAIMASAQYWFLIPLVPILLVYYIIQRLYRSTSREVKRIEALTRSPLFAQFSESLVGRSTIRAYGKEEDFIALNRLHINTNMRCWFTQMHCQRWLGGRLEVIGSFLILAIAIFVNAFRSTIDPGLAGLALVYSLQITQFLGFMVQQSVEAETQMNSVERIVHYTKVPNEPAPSKDDKIPPKNWPEKGEIIFENFQMRYREGMDLVLKGVNAHIKPCERIGVVGRSGAGKSSLMLCLFRMVEAAGGKITIDGYNIAEIPLSILRRAISIIPQEPTLFTGTVRSNLDPFNEYDDNHLWNVLEKAHMKEKIEKTEKKLDTPVAAGGENFSVGERQLLCLARALCRKAKILLIDECTASVDIATDALIQKTIEEEFNDCTRLTIAHRLNTIIGSDRILVMDKGMVAEFDTPKNLLSKSEGVFLQMVEKTGKANAKKLKEEALGIKIEDDEIEILESNEKVDESKENQETKEDQQIVESNEKPEEQEEVEQPKEQLEGKEETVETKEGQLDETKEQQIEEKKSEEQSDEIKEEQSIETNEKHDDQIVEQVEQPKEQMIDERNGEIQSMEKDASVEEEKKQSSNEMNESEKIETNRNVNKMDE